MTVAADQYLPGQLIALARSLLAQRSGTLTGVWPRAAAFLGRQALEVALGQLWARRAPELAEVSMRAQLLCLPTYLDAEVARQVAYTWTALSRACHHHAYELAPTSDELEAWLTDAERLFAIVQTG